MGIGFIIASAFLVTAMLLVPLFKKIGMGSVLGYLFSGMIVSAILNTLSHQLGILNAPELIRQLGHMAEFGVILMLFIVGLEIHPQKLWKMKAEIFGLGSSQVLLTTLLLGSCCMAAGLPWQQALLIGMTFSLSSTAIAIQGLNEKKWDQKVGGKKSFSTLLLQDLAVIPILASLPLLSARLVSPLSSPETTSNAASNAAVAAAAAKHATFDLLQYLPSWIHPFIAIVAVLLIYLLGRFTINPLFRLIADSKLQEIFTTAALGIVTVVAAFMVMVGLSPALGVFVAGVVLSESNYRHQLEADIAPFKGLFLGLFFMTIGASFDFEVLLSRPFFILSLGFGLVLVKMVAGIILGRIFRIERCDRLLYALALAQGGEFAFVILGEALTQGIISKEMMAILRIVVAISMMISPLLFFMYEKKLQAIAAKAEAKPRESDLIDETHPIIVAGFGRFGQMVVRLLASCGYRSTVLDFDPQHNETLKRFGWKVYYGDASRLDLLRVAGLDQARLMVIAIDDMETTVNLARTLKLHYPNLPLIVRARNRIAAYDLIDLGVKHIFRETFDTSLNAGETALKILGFRSYQAKRARLKFAEADNANLHKLAKLRKGDEKTFLSAAKSNELELSKLLRAELGHPDADALGDDGWDKA